MSATSMTTSFLNNFMSQNWEDLVMAHYPAEPDSVQSSLPEDLLVDTYGDQAWFSVVAFRLTDLSIRPITCLRWNDFWEINLRTYVRDMKGNKGVWFYSLDSSDLLGVMGARLLYGLPYNFARIHRAGSPEDRKIVYHGIRGKIADCRIEADWKDEQNIESVPGTIDHFLLERYRFWSRRRLAGSSSSACVRHVPYEAYRLDDIQYEGGLFASQGLNEPDHVPVLGHYCPGFYVEATAPEWAFSISGQANQR